MVQFGRELSLSQFDDWQKHYLDYNTLKEILQKRPPNPPESTDVFVDHELALSPTDTSNHDQILKEFRSCLDQEIEKAVLFFLEKQGEIATDLSALRLRHTEAAVSPEKADNLIDEYQRVGEELLKLVQFVELNVTAVRKILKKHDKKKHKSNHLSWKYLSRYFEDGSDSHLNQLYHYGGISALVLTLKLSFAELRTLRKTTERAHALGAQTTTAIIRKRSAPPARNRTNSAVLSYQSIPTTDADNRPYATHQSIGLEPNIYTFQDIPELDEPIIFQINMARQRLNSSSQYVEVLAAQLFVDSDSLGDENDEYLLKLDRKQQKISSFLNLMSTFLYMQNYYIVAPTSGSYAESLGSSAALAGVIIGMTPIAALLASFLYGWWSNHSYKSALLFAAFCSILGNILYALALPCNSLSMVIAGRYLNGFGSARAINRRYIADVFPRSERTAASAAFVTTGALGMAVGPAVAAMLSRITLTNDYFTAETGPGYVMFLLWSIYFICTMYFFEEPERNIAAPPKPPSLEMTSSERQALVSNGQGQGSNDQEHGSNSRLPQNGKEKKLPSLWKNIPVMTTLWIYFVLKLVLECLLSSTAAVTAFYFDWGMAASGTYLAILGLLMFPANLLVVHLSRRFDDREIIMTTLIIMLLGCFGLLYLGGNYSVTQYLFFGVCIFLSTNALESTNMSLLSKTIPREWAKGTFNSGLLATEAGTLGRAVGDIFLSAIAYQGFENVLNGTFLPLGLLVLVTTCITWKLFGQLEPADDDDDD